MIIQYLDICCFEYLPCCRIFFGCRIITILRYKILRLCYVTLIVLSLSKRGPTPNIDFPESKVQGVMVVKLVMTNIINRYIYQPQTGLSKFFPNMVVVVKETLYFYFLIHNFFFRLMCKGQIFSNPFQLLCLLR